MQKIFRNSIFCAIFIVVVACTHQDNSLIDTEANISLIENSVAELPVAISNNAVASAVVNGETRLYSFLGIEAGKEWSDVSKKAFRYANNNWTQLADVPVPEGRLASLAATVKNSIYIFGGYSVAEDHTEISTPEVLKFEPESETYIRVADIPVPTDDAVAVVYQDRYIYLISGWHNKGNINLVQVYDVATDVWQQATQFPASPVFGHAGGIVADTMVICDGVKIDYPFASMGSEAKRKYAMSDECYKGVIDSEDPYKIDWSKLPEHHSPARYRMAATGDAVLNKIIFVGGSDNPYNFNGIGYNGVPSKPVNTVFAYDLTDNEWMKIGNLNTAGMDYRGLLKFKNNFATIGGMDGEQRVQTRTHFIDITKDFYE
jgi:N-acetylneuraminic acid mutarotase